MASKRVVVLDKNVRHEDAERMVVIHLEDAARYRNSLAAIRKRLIAAFEGTNDMSLRHWVNTHGPIVDELMDELKQK